MPDIVASQSRPIRIGRLGENEHLRVVFDISEYRSEYPNATVLLLNKIPGTTTSYPVTGTEYDDHYFYWTVASSALTNKGLGQCELVVRHGEVIAKSMIYMTEVTDALGDDGSEPPDWDNWLTEFAEYVDEARGYAREAGEQAVASESWAVGGTDSRTGEDTDNAKYYSEQAAQSAVDAAESEGNAAASERNAHQSEVNASASETAAAGSATLSESWAVGGTGTRQGEDTDNAKHYAEVAQQGAEDSGYAWFDIDDSTGEMLVTITDSLSERVSFEINENTGNLEVIIP